MRQDEGGKISMKLSKTEGSVNNVMQISKPTMKEREPFMRIL